LHVALLVVGLAVLVWPYWRAGWVAEVGFKFFAPLFVTFYVVDYLF